MKIDDIKILLQKYYDGESSPQEEHQLKSFFTSNDVPEDMMADKMMFEHLATYTPEIPADLNDKISKAIDSKARKTVYMRLRIIGGIAAMICVIFSINAYITRYDDAITAKDTCATPEEAAVQTERALMAFSKALKKGQSNIDRAEQTTEGVNKIIIEKLKNLNNLNNLNNR